MQMGPQAAEALLDTLTFQSDLKFLSSDLLEGRAPAGRGEAIAVSYIESRLHMAGAVGPFEGGSYRQAVPLVRQTADRDMPLHITGNGVSREYAYGSEFVADSGVQQPRVDVDGELLFVGYGVEAPEYRWDDYKGVDTRGKIVVMLVNDPPATDSEPDLFGGRAMTYYGRWTYKYEEAQRRGAQGVLLVHDTDMAGYGWNVVESSWSGDQFSLAGESTEGALKLRGWFQKDIGRAIFKAAGQDLDTLMERAKRRDFQPVSLGLRAATTIRNETEHMTGWNVVGVLSGSDPERSGSCMAYSAHLDHLGKRAGDGDTIYNGAYDNSSGVAAVLNMADAIGSIPQDRRPPRSFMFALVTAEESGLLGSAWLAGHLPVKSSQVDAIINLDEVNLWGATDDLVLGAGDRTTLGEVVQRAASQLGMEVKDYPNPEVGSYFRSDHFSFSKVGIPAHSLQSGETYRGKPEGWGKAFFEEWTRTTYHQPSDEYSEDYIYDGALQVMTVALMAGWDAASMSEEIQWRPGDPFGRIRDQMRRQEGIPPGGMR